MRVVGDAPTPPAQIARQRAQQFFAELSRPYRSGRPYSRWLGSEADSTLRDDDDPLQQASRQHCPVHCPLLNAGHVSADNNPGEEMSFAAPASAPESGGQ